MRDDRGFLRLRVSWTTSDPDGASPALVGLEAADPREMLAQRAGPWALSSIRSHAVSARSAICGRPYHGAHTSWLNI